MLSVRRFSILPQSKFTRLQQNMKIVPSASASPSLFTYSRFSSQMNNNNNNSNDEEQKVSTEEVVRANRESLFNQQQQQDETTTTKNDNKKISSSSSVLRNSSQSKNKLENNSSSSSQTKELKKTKNANNNDDDSSDIPSWLQKQDDMLLPGSHHQHRNDAVAFSNPLSYEGVQPVEKDERFLNVVQDRAALRQTGQWSVKDTMDESSKTIQFGKIDELDTAVSEIITDSDRAIISVDEEHKYKNKLMFLHKFEKTPKHLTWKEMCQEIETLDCELDLDPSRPEEIYRLSFFYVHKKTGRRRCVWTAANDVSYAEGLTDLLAGVGSCLGRADVHRTIRFDNGKGAIRDINIRKNSRYTSEVMIAFRPDQEYNLYTREEEKNEWEKSMEQEGLPSWGFHPRLMDPEYRDTDDPLASYHIVVSAHTLSFVVLRAIERLLARPLKDFYRPSQVARTQVVSSSEDVGVVRAVMGWIGVEERQYPHYTPMEAIQDHWFGADAPFTLTVIVNKLREMTYLKKQNPEFQSWLSVRQRDTAVAIRGIRAKLLGVGSSRYLFAPLSYDPTVNRLLPKKQQRTIKASVSLGAMLGMPDETRHIEEVQKIAGSYKLAEGDKKKDKDDSDDTEKEEKKE